MAAEILQSDKYIHAEVIPDMTLAGLPDYPRPLIYPVASGNYSLGTLAILAQAPKATALIDTCVPGRLDTTTRPADLLVDGTYHPVHDLLIDDVASHVSADTLSLGRKRLTQLTASYPSLGPTLLPFLNVGRASVADLHVHSLSMATGRQPEVLGQEFKSSEMVTGHPFPPLGALAFQLYLSLQEQNIPAIHVLADSSLLQAVRQPGALELVGRGVATAQKEAGLRVWPPHISFIDVSHADELAPAGNYSQYDVLAAGMDGLSDHLAIPTQDYQLPLGTPVSP